MSVHGKVTVLVVAVAAPLPGCARCWGIEASAMGRNSDNELTAVVNSARSMDERVGYARNSTTVCTPLGGGID